MFAYIVTYTCLWWLIFFMVLPFGNKPPTDIAKGHADSAPSNPRLAIKIIITSILTTPITYFIIKSIEDKSLLKFFSNFYK